MQQGNSKHDTHNINPSLPVGWASFTITTSTTSTSSTSFTAAPSTASTVATTTPTLVGKGEVDVKLLLASRSLKVDDSLLLFLLVLLLVLLLVDRRLLPLGVNVGTLASFSQIELGSLLHKTYSIYKS